MHLDILYTIYIAKEILSKRPKHLTIWNGASIKVRSKSYLLQLKRLKVRLFFGATFFGSLLPSGHTIPRAIEKETAIPAILACFEENKSIT